MQSLIQDQGGFARNSLESLRDFTPSPPDPTQTARCVREGDKPRWRPVRAFDDGAKICTEFPRDLATGEAPPLFVTDKGGDSQLVNFRAKERYYVVNRLFDLAELRLNDTAVRISRNGSGGLQLEGPAHHAARAR